MIQSTPVLHNVAQNQNIISPTPRVGNDCSLARGQPWHRGGGVCGLFGRFSRHGGYGSIAENEQITNLPSGKKIAAVWRGRVFGLKGSIKPPACMFGRRRHRRRQSFKWWGRVGGAPQRAAFTHVCYAELRRIPRSSTVCVCVGGVLR